MTNMPQPTFLIPFLTTMQLHLIVNEAGYLAHIRDADLKTYKDGRAVFSILYSDRGEFDGEISAEVQRCEITVQWNAKRQAFDVDFIQE